MAVTTPTSSSLRRRIAGGKWTGRVGWTIFAAIVLIALFGSLFTPNSPTTSVGVPGAPPSGAYPLGLDFLGRDVLSRLLAGGRSTLLMGLAATALTYAVGITVGMLAGYRRSWIDPLLMRSVDVLLAVPALLVMLLGVTAFGGGSIVLVCAAALVLFPAVSRLVRTATLEASKRGFVEAAVARGENSWAIMFREILPTLAGPIVADIGIRFSWSIIMICGVNYLGLGVQPPAADWGVMLSENRAVLATNVWGVAAPALMIGLLIISVNLIGEGYVSKLEASGGQTR